MRKKGVVIFLIIILIIFLISYITKDYRIERMIENIGESIVGAKVELDNFHFSLIKLECSWQRLQIADKNNPWKNALETGPAQLKLETRPLFWRRVVIKNMTLQNVRTGTPRSSDGSLPKKKKQESSSPGFLARAKSSLQKQLSSLPVFDLSGVGKKLKIDSLVNVQNLQTVQAYELLAKQADSTFGYWQSQLKPDDYLERLNSLEKKIKSVKIDEMKDISGLTQGLKKIKDIQKEAESLKKEITDKHAALSSDFNNIQKQINEIQGKLQQDIENAKQLAHLKDLSVKDVSLLLFGNAVVQRVEKLLGYVALARQYLPTSRGDAKPEKQKPPRLKGQDIDFPFHYRYPKFLLRNALFSAATEAGDTARAYFIEGQLSGLTNQPPIFGKPTQLVMNLKKIDGNAYSFRGAFDHIANIAKDTIVLKAEKFALGKISLKKQKYFPAAVKLDRGDFEINGLFIGDQLDLSLNLSASPVDFYFESEAKDKVSQIVRDVLNGIKQLKLNAKLTGKESDLKLNMNSNVDKVLAKQVQATLAKNLREAQTKLENYVRQQADLKKQKVEAIIEKNRKTIYDKIDNAKNMMDKKLKEVEDKKKQIEQKLEQEKKKLEDKAKNKLKNFFKKP